MAELVDPELCGMCAEAHLPENEHSILVASTGMSHIRLVRNQAHPGYTVVIIREHLTDLGQLHAVRLNAFWRDVQRAGRAVDRAIEPRKINYRVMGHRAPHFHCHVFPQHLTDDPLQNVDVSDGPVTLRRRDRRDRRCVAGGLVDDRPRAADPRVRAYSGTARRKTELG